MAPSGPTPHLVAHGVAARVAHHLLDDQGAVDGHVGRRARGGVEFGDPRRRQELGHREAG